MVNDAGVHIVIPAYNEESKIGGVIKDLKKHGYKKIVVVDDGSKDSTAKMAEKQNITVLRHIINRGQGAALKTGIDYALKKGAKIIVTFDSDGQHLAEDIKKLVNPIKKAETQVSLGSRFLKNSKVPLIRRMVLKGGAFLFLLMYSIKLTDSHNGLRAMSRKAAEQIRITSNGMEHASEIVEEISKKKIKFKEIPVTIKYTDYSKVHGQSSLNAFRILFKMILKKLMR